MPLVCNVAGCKQAGRVFKNRAGLEAHKRFKHGGASGLEQRGPFLETLLVSRKKIYDSLVGVDRQIIEKAQSMGIDARTLGVEFIPLGVEFIPDKALQPQARGPVQHPEEEEDEEVQDAEPRVESIMDTVARHTREKHTHGELPIRPLLPFRRSGS